ncbi:hypothetical protein AC579_2594 [Pseudocercospora musae]|uniref:Uncharacterized protein n=1 Tax=Pseudocercospora musae TaxID=113226 RepID=A0A139IEP1_9PEZI|nr:hypothetical protein AC579_2594 [Pseudocercospora musae]
MADSSAMEKTTALVEEKLAKAAPRDFEQAKDLLADMIIELLSIGGDECIVRTVNLCSTKPSAHLGARMQEARRVSYPFLVLELQVSELFSCWIGRARHVGNSSLRGFFDHGVG